MPAMGSSGLEKTAIDPAFAVGDRALVPRSRIARHEFAPDDQPLIEACASRYVDGQRTAFVVFPTARAELLFHFGDPFRVRDHDRQPWRDLPRAALLGPRRHRYWQSAGPTIDWFLIQLSPLGCQRLLGKPFGSWWGIDLALTELWGEVAERLHWSLQNTVDFDERTLIAAQTVQSLEIGRGGDQRMSTLGRQARTGQAQTVAEMARYAGVGKRRLRQLFNATYGCSPKAYLNLMRFNRQLLEVHPLYAAREAVQTGYADQSHAIQEFRRFAGMTPGSYARIKAEGDALVVTGAPITVGLR